MSENLKRFLIGLASNADVMKRYADNPAGELSRADLTDAERAAVLSRDAGRIRAALGSGDADTMTQMGQDPDDDPPEPPPIARVGLKRPKPKSRPKAKPKSQKPAAKKKASPVKRRKTR